MANLGWKFYMINASWNVVFLVIVYFLWVETRNVPLEAIAAKFGDLNESVVVQGVSNCSDVEVEQKISDGTKAGMN